MAEIRADPPSRIAWAPVKHEGFGDIMRRFFDSDIWYSFKRSPVTIALPSLR